MKLTLLVIITISIAHDAASFTLNAIKLNESRLKSSESSKTSNPDFTSSPASPTSLPTPLPTPPLAQPSLTTPQTTLKDSQCPPHYSNLSRLYSPTTESTTNASPISSLRSSHCIIIGLGGVGSWVTESLSRTALGRLTLIDLDDVCSSNINRQICADTNTVGMFKAEVLKERCNRIDANCEVETVLDFIDGDNMEEILDPLIDDRTIIIDTIDSSETKADLISYCFRKNVPIITCGSAGGLTDPTLIRCCDLSKVEDDRLLFWTRKRLRKYHRFPKGPAQGEKNTHRVKSWNVKAVHSIQRKDVKKSQGKESKGGGGLRKCDSMLGTVSFCTGIVGFVAAGKAVEMIVEDDFTAPNVKLESVQK